MGVKLGLLQEGEEHSLMVFESTVLGKISGSKDAVENVIMRKLMVLLLTKYNYSGDKKSMRWEWYMMCIGERGNACRVFVTKAHGRC